MLTTTQSKLVKLAEEASEVGKEALKGVHYGVTSKHKGQYNRTLIREEMMDMFIIYRQLVALGVLDPIYEKDIQRHLRKKLPKIKRHTERLYAEGAIEEPWIPEAI